LLKVREGNMGAWWGPGRRSFKNLQKGRTRWFPSNKSMHREEHGWSLGQVKVCHSLAPMSFGGEELGRLPYTPMLILRCSPWGRKFPFFLTYCKYNGALKACQGRVSTPKIPNSSLPQLQ
jgi:hypothetical protein